MHPLIIKLKRDCSATEWIVRSGNHELMKLEYNELKAKRLCSKHFDDDAWFPSYKGAKGRRLKINALPKMTALEIPPEDSIVTGRYLECNIL